jgi:hypothetical protein
MVCGMYQYTPPQDAVANANSSDGVWYDVWKCTPFHPGAPLNLDWLWLWLGLPGLVALFIVILVMIHQNIAPPKPYLWRVRRQKAQLDWVAPRIKELQELERLQDKLGLDL